MKHGGDMASADVGTIKALGLELAGPDGPTGLAAVPYTTACESRGRPSLGAGPADVVPVRLDPELKAAVEGCAASEHTSTSEIIRKAFRNYLDVA